jgi:hypothetical protein
VRRCVQDEPFRLNQQTSIMTIAQTTTRTRQNLGFIQSEVAGLCASRCFADVLWLSMPQATANQQRDSYQPFTSNRCTPDRSS